ncbi:MAG TPA: FAD-binding protein, partial [Mycobacteriales bacterium]|nr:FAD-binding protein [Mycobacteriales bacterium]
MTDHAELRTYESDGLASYRCIPGLVILAESAEDVAYVVGRCAAAGVPFVARGSGTGLSGGALPRSDGVLIVLSRMRRIVDVDLDDERAVVQPGVINADLTKAVAADGFYYAPDPSSQQVCSLGGNVAENSGGAHCLKYGFTAHHVTALELVLPDGSIERVGGRAPDPVGYDVGGAVVGSEGTLCVVTEATVRLLRKPQAVQTVLAGFRTIEDAGAAVSAIIAAGVLPAAIELMDALAIEAAEAAVHPNYPAAAGAVMVAELDGPACEVDAQLAEVQRFSTTAGAFEIRVARDDVERALIWRGRKSAFAAVGRISPDYIVQDGVIPRTALPEVLLAIESLAAAAGIRVANVFHAGDGNLHPLVLFDDT